MRLLIFMVAGFTLILITVATQEKERGFTCETGTNIFNTKRWTCTKEEFEGLKK